jgi:Fic family protein
MPLPPKKIVPFHLKAFPPRHLRKLKFSKQLKTANQLLQEYDALFSSSSLFPCLFSQLINLEAITSIESQQVKTTLERFLRFLSEKHSRKSVGLNLIANYREALLWACQHTYTPLSKEFLCAIHSKVKKTAMSKADIGVYRGRQNWIGPHGCKMEEAYFYPPAHTEVNGLMQKLFSYANKHSKEPLVQLALIFAGLLIIHPFMDGNGRVARILIPFLLCQKTITQTPCLFLSRYFLKHRLQYFYHLFNTTQENQWESWILFFLKGIIIETRRSLHIFKQMRVLNEKMQSQLPTLKKEILFFLFLNPIFSHSSFKTAKGSTQDLKKLMELKFIRKQRNGIYYFTHLLQIFNYYF